MQARSRHPSLQPGVAIPITRGDRPGLHVLQTEQRVAAGPRETFAYFSDAAHLDALTPPTLGFEILTPLPVPMRKGTLIEYRLRLLGFPVRWVTRIDEWTPPRGFTDVQLRGPYAHWVHTHQFVPRAGGTLIRDRLEYALPAPTLSAPVHALFVRPMLREIFAYRRSAIAKVLG